MAEKGDSIRIYGTSGDIVRGAPTMLGGYRSRSPLSEVAAWCSSVIAPLAVVGASGNNTGRGRIAGDNSGNVAFWSDETNAATSGALVAIASGETKHVESADKNKWVVVSRENSNGIVGGMLVDFAPLAHLALPILQADKTHYANGYDNFACIVLRNETGSTITGVTLRNEAIVSETLTGFTNTGGETSVSGANFSDFPARGFIRILQPCGAFRCAFYYSHRTDTKLYYYGQPGLHYGTGGYPVAGDTIELYGGFAMAQETPTAGRVQDVADSKTAPTGLTFSALTTLNIGTMASLEEVFIWLWIPATVYNQQPFPAAYDAAKFFDGGAAEITASVTLGFTSAGVTYSRAMDWRRAVFSDLTDTKDSQARAIWISNDGAISRNPDDAHEWKVGDASNTDFMVALSVPDEGLTATSYYTIRKLNKFGLLSQNDYAVPVIIDENGDEVFPISAPYGISITSDGNGYVRVIASYAPGIDPEPADTWAVYSQTGGVAPDPGTDTPYLETMVVNTSSGARTINYLLGPYPIWSVVRVLVRARRLDDGAESPNTTDTQIVSPGPSAPPSSIMSWMGGAFGAQGVEAAASGTSYALGPDAQVAICWDGEVQVWADASILWWRVSGDKIYVPHNNTYGTKPSGSGAYPLTGSASPFYLNVDGTNAQSLTVASGTSGDWLTQGLSVADLSAEANEGPVQSASGKVVFFAYRAGQWVPYLRVQPDGILDIDDGFDIVFVETQLEALTR